MMGTTLRTALVLALTVLTSQAHAATLSREEHDRLRLRLENLFNEQDLLVRNQRSDRSDISRQQREFEVLKVFERVPFKEDIPGLKKSLEASSSEWGMKIVSFDKLPSPRKVTLRVPESVYSDQTPIFRLKDEHVAEPIYFRAVVEGDEADLQEWVASWAEEQMRLTELDNRRSLGKRRWEVHAHAFRFKDVKFPSIKTRDPMELLPRWAARDPQRFAREEPILWKLVNQIRAVSPQARPLFRNREDLLLNGARMSFYVSKAVPGGFGTPSRQSAGQTERSR